MLLINSENILTDSGNDGDSGGGFTGGGNQTIPELTVELITTYNDQTAFFNKLWKLSKKFYCSCSTKLDYETQSLPLVFVLHIHWQALQ